MNLSIIIVSYNTRKLLSDCLHSIDKSLSKDDIETEVIVIDNNSTDGTREWLKQIQAKSERDSSSQASQNDQKEINKKSFDNFNIKTIFNDENKGFSKANNQGIRESRGEYLLFLNPDTKLFPGTISHLLRVAKNKKDAGIIAPKLLNKNGKKSLSSCFKKQTTMNAFREFVLGKKNAFQKYTPRGGCPTTVDNVISVAMLVPKSVINVVDLFDEKYLLYYEDLDYCRRVRRAGFSIYYVPQAKVVFSKRVRVENKQKLIGEGKRFYGFLKYYFIKILGVLNSFRTERLFFVKTIIIVILTALFTCLLFWRILPNVF